MCFLLLQCVFLFYWVHSQASPPPLPACTPCITTTYRQGQTSQTLIYQTSYDCASSTITQCQHQSTTYSVCNEKGHSTCFRPQSHAVHARVNVYANYKKGRNPPILFLVASNITTQLQQKLQVCFDICHTIDLAQGSKLSCGGHSKEQTYTQLPRYLHTSPLTSRKSGKDFWYVNPSRPYVASRQRDSELLAFDVAFKNVSLPCKQGYCTPLCLVFPTPPPVGTMKGQFTIGIYKTEKSPYGIILVETESHVIRTIGKKAHATFWSEMGTVIEIPPVTKNLFVDLAERIAGQLDVKNCYVCAGTGMSDQWPWNGLEVTLDNLTKVYNISWRETERPDKWILRNELVGFTCFIRQGHPFSEPVGMLECEGGWICNGTKPKTFVDFTNPDNTQIPQYVNMGHLQVLWDDPCNASRKWVAPDSLYWICGTAAYATLPPGWSGACVLGTIRPSFFLLPLETGEHLGVPVYDELGRAKRSLRIHTWQNNEWPPERIIQVYGPATWAADGMYGYRTPIYMLNRLIRLQAVLEIITNETSQALSLLAKTNTQIRTAIYQNRLALDFLLAAEGGVCGKFNLTNCCLQIDDNGQAIEQITERMRNLAHVPVQTWTGALDTGGWFGSMFADWKRILFLVGLAFGGLLLLPCLIPMVQTMVTKTVDSVMIRDTPKLLHLAANHRERRLSHARTFSRSTLYRPAESDYNPYMTMKGRDPSIYSSLGRPTSQ